MGLGKQKGFTLTEIMIVVVILGVLASIAVVSFSSSKDEATVQTEINTVFAAFRLSQESYRSENNVYLALGNSDSDRYPQTPSPSAYQIVGDSNYPDTWTDLVLDLKQSYLRCSYGGGAGTASDTSVGSIASSFNYTTPDESWFYIFAQCDIDGDGVLSTYFTHSANNIVQSKNKGE